MTPRSIHALPHGGLTELALAGFGEGAGHSPLYQTIRRDNTPSRVLYYRSPTANPAEVAGQGLQCRRQHHAPENSSGPRWTAGAPRGRVSDLADKLTGDLQINSVCSWTRERSRCCLNSSEADPERSHNKQTSLFNVLAGSRQSRELDDRWNFQSGGCVISAAAILSRVCEDNEESRHGLD